MPRYDKTRFRITPWPETRLPLPNPRFVHGEFYEHRLELASSEELKGLDHLEDDELERMEQKLNEEGRTIYEYDEVERPTEQFGETYLELNEIDLDDRVEARRFVQRWSVLGVYSPEWAPAISHHYFGFPAAGESFRAITEELKEVGPHGEVFDDIPIAEIEYWEEFRIGAMCLRDMTTAWRVLQGELDGSNAEWVTPCWSNAVESSVIPDAPEAHAELVLVWGLTHALQPFAPQLRLSGEDGKLPEGLRLGFGWTVPLYSVCCAELFNHIVEGAKYKTCANETCGRLFVRQQGRAEHGQHRTRGVKYCSAECAKAQAQRQYRRRKASANGSA